LDGAAPAGGLAPPAGLALAADRVASFQGATAARIPMTRSRAAASPRMMVVTGNESRILPPRCWSSHWSRSSASDRAEAYRSRGSWAIARMQIRSRAAGTAGWMVRTDGGEGHFTGPRAGTVASCDGPLRDAAG